MQKHTLGFTGFISVGDFKLFNTPDYRPTPADMVRLVNSYAPEVALVELRDREDAVKVGETLRASFPNLGIIGFAEEWQEESVIKTSHGSLRVIPTNLSLEEFRHTIVELFEAAQGPKQENVIAFLPSKAGSGASSTALNVTGALAHKCGKSAILLEADLHSGPAGMYLGLKSMRSIVDALEMHRADECWNELVTPADRFDLLPACNIRGRVPHISTWAYKRLLFQASRRYEYVVFDLPEVVNDATEAVVTSAKAIYVVCTPEVPSLVLARKRCSSLIDRGVPSDRLHIVLNRYSKDGPDPTAITDIVGYPIAQRAFEKVSRRLAGWNPAIPTLPTSPMPNGTSCNRWCPPPNLAAVPPSMLAVKS